MKTFVWTVVLLLAVEASAKLTRLAVNKFPERTRGETALDTAIAVGLIVWGAAILAA